MSLHSNWTRNSVAALALTATAFAASPADALSDKAKLKSMSFNVEADYGTIRVISTDGKKWDKLKPGAVALNADFSINTRWPGYVDTVTIRLGSCSGASCMSFPSVYFRNVEERDYSGSAITGFQTSLLPISSPDGIAINPAADAILSRCNQHLQADGPTKSHSFTQEMFATLAVDTDESLNMPFIRNQPDEVGGPSQTWVDHTDSDAFTVNVICDPVIKPATNNLAYDHGAFDVENVRLFLTTYQSNQPGSNPATVCPALKVTSRAQANQAGPVSMRIWRQKNGGPITSEFKQAWASYDAVKNGYFATYETWENVGATSYFQFKTEIVEAGPFGPFDGWKDITVHCTSPGGGGLTTAPVDHPDLPKPKAKWQGEVIVADSAGRDKSCPRKGQVFFSVTRPAPGDFDYRISCSNGAFFTGTATGYDQGSGVYEAYGAHDLSVNRTRSIQCTLQELQPAPVTVAVDKQDFTCNNPAIDPAADDLVAEPRPNPVKPQRPLVAADPAPICDRNEKLVRGKCVGKPGISILCRKGFELKGETCIRKPTIVVACDRGEQRIDGRCVKKPEVSIFCKKGFKLIGKTCVRQPAIVKICDRGEKLVRGNCVRKPIVAPVNRLTAPQRLIGKPEVRRPALPEKKRVPRRAS